MPPWPEISQHHAACEGATALLSDSRPKHNLRSYHGKVWDWSKVRDFLKSQWSALFTSVKAVLDRQTDFGTVADGRRLGNVTTKCRWDSRQILGQERDTGGQLMTVNSITYQGDRPDSATWTVFTLRCWHLGKLLKGTWEFFVPTIFGSFLKSEMISKRRVKTSTFKMRGRAIGVWISQACVCLTSAKNTQNCAFRSN